MMTKNVASQNNLALMKTMIFMSKGLSDNRQGKWFYIFIFQEYESNHVNYTEGGHVCDSCSDVVNSFKHSKVFGDSNTRNRKWDWCVFTRFFSWIRNQYFHQMVSRILNSESAILFTNIFKTEKNMFLIGPKNNFDL